MSPVARLGRANDVREVLRAGATAGGPAAVVHALRRADDGPARMTVVAGRRLGSAVVRNRAKRRLRAALEEAALPPGCDLVVVARPGALDAEYGPLRHELARSAGQAGARAKESR